MSETLWTALGWTGTAIFVASFLVKSRSMLHALGLVGCVVKLVYTWHYSLWPLAANWLMLIGIEREAEYVEIARKRIDTAAGV